MGEKEYCFICQRFDGGVFDQRYKDIIEPVIKQCGLLPYRVDEDPYVDEIFEDILSHIKSARIIVAEISTDNPNVWLEVGLSIAYNKPIVFICDNKRKDFPFDIRHRKILVYKTESSSDFRSLEKALKEQLLAKLEKNSKGKRPSNKEIALLKAIHNQSNNTYVISEKESDILEKMTSEEKKSMLLALVNKNYLHYVPLNDDNNSYRIVLTDRAYNLKGIKKGDKR